MITSSTVHWESCCRNVPVNMEGNITVYEEVVLQEYEEEEEEKEEEEGKV